MTPTIDTIRPGVSFAPDAAASFRRAEAGWHRRIRVTSSYRDWDRQMRMYRAWQAWVTGTGPKPYHSRAIHPKYSKHCLGLGLDSPDWTDPEFVAHMAEHGWIRTAASDPTERHHFEYQWWRDQHRNDAVPSIPTALPEPEPITKGDDTMTGRFTYKRASDGKTVRVVHGEAYFEEHTDPEIKNSDIDASLNLEEAEWPSMPESYRDNVYNATLAVRTGAVGNHRAP